MRLRCPGVFCCLWASIVGFYDGVFQHLAFRSRVKPKVPQTCWKRYLKWSPFWCGCTVWNPCGNIPLSLFRYRRHVHVTSNGLSLFFSALRFSSLRFLRPDLAPSILIFDNSFQFLFSNQMFDNDTGKELQILPCAQQESDRKNNINGNDHWRWLHTLTEHVDEQLNRYERTTVCAHCHVFSWSAQHHTPVVQKACQDSCRRPSGQPVRAQAKTHQDKPSDVWLSKLTSFFSHGRPYVLLPFFHDGGPYPPLPSFPDGCSYSQPLHKWCTSRSKARQFDLKSIPSIWPGMPRSQESMPST